MTSLTAFGAFLWSVFTLIPIAIAAQQFYYFRTLRRYTLQPTHGSKYSDHINPYTIRYLCLFLQVLLFVCLLASLSVNEWSSLGDVGNYGSVKLGLINYSRPPLTDRNLLRCDIDYADKMVVGSSVFSNYPKTLAGSACFVVVASSIVIFIFALISLFLSFFQLLALLPFIKFKYFAETQPGQELSTAMSGGLWSRAHTILILHFAMTFMYGVLACAIGGVRPGDSFFLMIGVTIVTVVQYFCVARYIQSLPIPRSENQPLVELTDMEAAHAAVEETVASAVALSAATTVAIEKLRICISKQEAEGAAELDGAQPNEELHALAAAEAMIRTASEAASAASVSARAGVSALQPLLLLNMENGNRERRNPDHASLRPAPLRANSLRNQNNAGNPADQLQALPGSSRVEPHALPASSSGNNNIGSSQGEFYDHALDRHEIQPEFHIDADEGTGSSTQGEQSTNGEFLPGDTASTSFPSSSSAVSSPPPFVNPAAIAPADASVVLHVDAIEGNAATSSNTTAEGDEQDDSQLPSPSNKV